MQRLAIAVITVSTGIVIAAVVENALEETMLEAQNHPAATIATPAMLLDGLRCATPHDYQQMLMRLDDPLQHFQGRAELSLFSSCLCLQANLP